MRILSGENHPRVFCSQGNGGVPCAAPFQGRPEPPGVGLGLVDDQRLSLQRPASRSCLGPLGFPCGSDEQFALSASSCRGRFAFRQPFPRPFGHIPNLKRLRMPTSCAFRLEVFRMVLADQIQHRPSPKSASTRVVASMLPRQRRPRPVAGVPLSFRIGTSPSGHQAPPILRVPSRRRTARSRSRFFGQVAFRSRALWFPFGPNNIRRADPPGRFHCRGIGLSLLTPQG